MEILIVSLAACLAGAISTSSGMGGGVLLFAVLSMLMPLNEAIAVHAVAQVFSNGARVVAFRKSIEFGLIPAYALGSAIAIVLVGVMWSSFNPAILNWIVALLLIGYASFEPAVRAALSNWVKTRRFVFFPAGLFIGATGMFVGAVGPLLTPILRARLTEKQAFIGTKAAMQLWVQSVKTLVFATLLSFAFGAVMAQMAGIFCGLIIGTAIGRYFVTKISEGVFAILVRSMLVVAAINLMVA